MALKNFEELYHLDISSKVKKNDGLDYFNWLDCILTLRELGMTPVYGVSDIKELNSGQIIVTVWVIINDEKYTITYTDARSRDFEFIKQRAFVKCVAIHWGLGLKLWEREAGGNADSAPAAVDRSLAIKIPIEFGKAVNVLGDTDAVHKRIGTTKATLAEIISKGSEKEQQDTLAKILGIMNPF